MKTSFLESLYFILRRQVLSRCYHENASKKVKYVNVSTSMVPEKRRSLYKISNFLHKFKDKEQINLPRQKLYFSIKNIIFCWIHCFQSDCFMRTSKRFPLNRFVPKVIWLDLFLKKVTESQITTLTLTFLINISFLVSKSTV